MKKILSLVLVLGLMTGVASLVHAGTTDNVVLTVTVGGTNYSIDIASGTQGFSSVNLGAQASLYIGSASNDGNIVADWECQGTIADGAGIDWTLDDAVAADTYGLMIGTSAVGGAEPDWDPGANPPVVSSVTTSAASMGYTEGIAAGDQVGIWARLSMPTSSGGAGQYTFTLSIIATAD